MIASEYNIDKMKAKVASQCIKEWMENLPGPIADESGFFLSGSSRR